MRYFYRVIALFLVLGAVFYSQSFSGVAISFLGQLQQALSLPFLVVKDIVLSHSLVENLSKLQLENQDLRAKALVLRLGAKNYSGKLIPAKIFATYPFNDKGSITIALGKNDGIQLGAVILATPNIFLGQVSSIGPDWSEVRTVFDATHNIAVRVGARGVPALLSGGSGATLGMIDKSRPVYMGDDIYVAARGIPYGLEIGTLGEIRELGGGAFKEADVVLPYSLGDLDQVLVLSN